MNTIALKNGARPAFVVTIAGPALIFAGIRFPGSLFAKAALVGIGAGLVWSNWSELQAEAKSLVGRDS